MRTTEFTVGGYYHIYNRGVDKRDIFVDHYDQKRFFQSMEEFNVSSPIGSIFQNSFRRSKDEKSLSGLATKQKLVEFVCYCLNPNHYHFILKGLTEGGIVEFMHKLGTGYTRHFNEKYKRTGSLFQGPFKSIEIESNEYLLYLSVYVNLNDRIHQLDKGTGHVKSRSSWAEYMGTANESFCETSIILEQYGNVEAYRGFAEGSLAEMIERKESERTFLE